MKIREVAKETPKVETPFVVGGVYKANGSGDYWLLARGAFSTLGTYSLVVVRQNSSGDAIVFSDLVNKGESEVRQEIEKMRLTYVPDAELVVPAPEPKN